MRRIAVRRWAASLRAFLLRRRIGLGPDDVELGYAREQVPVMLILMFVLALETAVVGLLVPWPIVHVLDVCAVLQVVVALAVLVTRPHFVSPDRLVLRNGARFELELPLTSITAVSATRKSHRGGTFQFQDDVAELAIVVGDQTNVLVELTEPVLVALPNGTTREVEQLRFRTDEPARAVTAIREAANGLAAPGTAR
ncbi:hypothetical protein SAMN02982929_05880 [Saccharopolyspora kobensis]|uniref:Uncharacterized protein n=1 Tax=Saccharopolyspora kobensis TaxID=146035 RepID=A0A1H6E9T7_9PSEU|nr:hypothetical protein [Saccharopolyspora kobensis]SEG93714.1 hypothetical protein SAMN02982929_05880 [Saccharopolyspora kobensis]SFD47223.1 hypothetical protein SAMN05216506_104411 [Saccharopolyspora kobensis]